MNWTNIPRSQAAAGISGIPQGEQALREGFLSPNSLQPNVAFAPIVLPDGVDTLIDISLPLPDGVLSRTVYFATKNNINCAFDLVFFKAGTEQFRLPMQVARYPIPGNGYSYGATFSSTADTAENLIVSYKLDTGASGVLAISPGLRFTADVDRVRIIGNGFGTVGGSLALVTGFAVVSR